jgi:hypothetical protein
MKILLFSLLAGLSFGLWESNSSSASSLVPGCYIVSFKSGLLKTTGTYELNAQTSAKASANLFGRITAEFTHTLNGFSVCGVRSEELLNSLRSNPQVERIEQDRTVSITAISTVVNPQSWGLDR